MSKIKILFLSFAIGLIVSTSAYAQTPDSKQAPVLVAEVNINSAKVVNQVDNNFNISFNISNGQGIQSNVKYAVSLIKKEKGSQNTIDQKVYDEVLNLNENTSIEKNIIYTAPESLSGSFSLFLTSYNNKGLPLGFYSLGEVKLTALKKGLEIVSNSCSVSTATITIGQPITKINDLYTGETMKVSCTVSNQTNATVSILPVFETRDRSAYGDISTNAVEQFNGAVTLKPLEKKSITVTLPEIKEPGSYFTSIAFASGDMKSNSVSTVYNVGGTSSDIINISPDADYYSKKENANIMILWSGATAKSADVTITTKWNRVCGTASTQNLVKGKDTIVVPINKSCFNPTITVTLKDAEGVVLDEQVASIKTTSREDKLGIFSGITGTVALIAILVLLAGLGIYMKRKGMNKSATTLGILVLGLSMSVFSFSDAYAYTYLAGPGGNIQVTLNVRHDVSSPNQVPGVFTPFETMYVDGMLHSTDTVTNTVSMTAVTVANNLVVLFDDPVILQPNGTAFSNTDQFTAPDCTDPSGTCPYDVNFTTIVTQSTPPPPASCTAYVRFIGSFRYGGVIWLGPATHPEVRVTVAVVGNLAQGSTTNEPYDTVIFVIPTNAQQSYMGEFYGVEGFDHGWVVSTDLAWACGDQTQNYSTCFVADTKVDLADGTKKNIQDVKIGDVLKGETTNNTVLGFHRPELDGKLYSFNGGRYFVTEEHPFKTTDGWKSINPDKTATENIGITVTELKIGDTLITDHGLEKIMTIDSKDEPKDTPLYNFKLDGDHTYYADGYLVHNKQECNGNLSCTNNISCIDPYTGYRVTNPSVGGTCPAGCRYPGQPNRNFCYGYAPYPGSAYCPTPLGACTN